MTDYTELHKAGWDSLPEPKTLPSGHWDLRANAVFYNAPKETGKKPRISVRFTAVAPCGDVDPRSVKSLGEGYDFGLNDEIGMPYGGMAYDSLRDMRTVGKHFKLYDKQPPADMPLVVETDEGVRINPEFAKVIVGSMIRGKITSDEYQGETRNQASDFTKVE